MKESWRTRNCRLAAHRSPRRFAPKARRRNWPTTASCSPSSARRRPSDSGHCSTCRRNADRPHCRAPAYPLAPSVEPLHIRAEQYAEALRTRGLEIQRAEYETYLARLRRIPDVSIGVEVLKMPDLYPVMAIGGMNLPIWEQRNRAVIREQQAEQEAARAMAMQELNEVRQSVAQAYFQARLSQRLRVLYANVLLPQAEAVMRQADVFFRYQDASFSNVIETTLAYHNFLLAYHRAVADYGQSLGRLERAIGATAQIDAIGEESLRPKSS